MNKVISHIHYIYITSPLSKKKLGYNPFTINIYFNSSQYYPTLGKTLAIKLSLHLISSSCVKVFTIDFEF
jgi:hypothetical protein